MTNTDSITVAKTKAAKLGMMLKIDALLCLVAGLAMAGLAMAGPLAVWLGLSDFRLGFGFLQIVNGWADWIAGGTFIVAIVILVTAKVLKFDNGLRLSALAFLGTIFSTLAFVVPESFRPPDGTPPIHDITTNLQDPPRFVAIESLRADAPNSTEYGSGRDMTPEKLRTMQQSAYPEIVPQLFEESADEVFDKALDAAESLGWDIVEANKSAGRLEATDTTFWFRFKDDVVVMIDDSTGQTILNARSVSRVGVSDVGKNAARLREFFSLLQERS